MRFFPSNAASRLFFAMTAAAVLAIGGIGVAQADSGPHGDMHGGHGGMKTAFGVPGDASKVSRSIDVVMMDTSFTPTEITVQAGETIRFAVTNRSGIDHDFTLGDQATQAAHRQEMSAGMAGMHHGADANAVMVKAGETKDLIWTFTTPGKFEYDCNIPGHFESGMTGVLTVVKGKPAQGK